MENKLAELVGELMKVAMQQQYAGKAPFHIYKRPTRKKVGGKPIFRFYVQFLDMGTGLYQTAVSSKQTSHSAAYTWAMNEIARRADAGEPSRRKDEITFEKFAKGFFDETSDFMKHRGNRGRVMSWNHREHNATYLRKYILPYFGEKPVSKITDDDVEDFQDWLLKQPRNEKADDGKTLTAATGNKVNQALRHITTWARKKKILKADPFLTIENLSDDKGTERGTFEFDEVQKMYALPLEAWNGDPIARLACLVSAATGMRKGEVQGLQRSKVKTITRPDGSALAALEISASWERRGNLKGTKSGKSRIAWLPSRLSVELLEAMEKSPHKDPDHFIFYSIDPDKPMSHKKIDKDFARACDALGIQEAERRRRRLSYHSLRHFANTFLINSGLPVLRTQQFIGHASLSMTQNYLHAPDDQSDIVALTGRLFEEAKS